MAAGRPAFAAIDWESISHSRTHAVPDSLNSRITRYQVRTGKLWLPGLIREVPQIFRAVYMLRAFASSAF